MDTPTDDSSRGSSRKQLEEKIAFVERHVGELDSVVRELFEKMTALEKAVARHREDVGQRFESLERGPEDDVPPHWGR